MKKNYLFSAIALCVCLFTACNKEIDTPQTESSEENKEGVITYIRATGNENASKGSIDGTSGNFSWNVDDQIAVWDNDANYGAGGYNVSDKLAIKDFSGDNATFSFTDLGKRSNYAVSPAWIRVEGNPTSVNLPDTYTLAQVADEKSPVPMIAVNDGDFLHFKQLGALLRITLNNLPPSTRSVTIDFNGKKVQGTFAVSYPGTATPSIATEAASDGNDVITINIPAHEEEWLDNQVVNIPVPTGTYTKVTVTSYTEAGTATLTMTIPIKPGLNTSWKPIRTSALKATVSLPVFTVNASGKRVYMAESNLQYTRPSLESDWATGSWSFMPKAYSLVETSSIELAEGTKLYKEWNKETIEEEGRVGNGTYSHENETAIGLFAWGTSGHDWGETRDLDGYYGSRSYPWIIFNDTSTKTYGPYWSNEEASNTYPGDLTGVWASGDWGVEAGTLTDKAGTASNWRTPTYSEFRYLFKSRKSGGTVAGVVNAKFVHAIVNNRRGLLLFPDKFVMPAGITVNADQINVIQPASAKTEYSADEWELLSSMGAVFLPATGQMNKLEWCAMKGDPNYTDPGKNGYYHTATVSNKKADLSTFAQWKYTLTFYNDESKYCTYSIGPTSRRFAHAVRLIRDL